MTSRVTSSCVSSDLFAPPGLFPFALVGTDVLRIAHPSLDPMTWTIADRVTIPNVNNNFTVGNAVALGGDGYVYLLGGDQVCLLFVTAAAASPYVLSCYPIT